MEALRWCCGCSCMAFQSPGSAAGVAQVHQMVARPATTQPSGTSTTSHSPPSTTTATSSPPLIIRGHQQRTREPLPRPLPASNPAPAAVVPTAPPAPDATEHFWSKTRLAHTEPSVPLGGSGLYAGRVLLSSQTLPALLETRPVADPGSGVQLEQFVAAHFFYKGQAGSSEDFEVLSCSKTSWRPAMGGFVTPENAIVCGRTVSGRPLYFGRAFDEGQYHYGTADPEDGLLYSMAHAGTWVGCVRTSQNFDILVAE